MGSVTIFYNSPLSIFYATGIVRNARSKMIDKADSPALMALSV